MSLVTIQRSPTPSDDVEKQDVVVTDDLRQSEPSVNKSSSASEDFLAVKGAAMALPQGSRRRESLPGNQGSLTILEVHLRKIYETLRSNDALKLAVSLENISSSPSEHHRYLCLVSSIGRQEKEECILLGVDILTDRTSFGLVLPVLQDMTIQPDGDGGFKVFNKDLDHLFKPVSVQALWSAIQSIDQALVVARNNNYFSSGLNHDWVSYYKGHINSSRQHINEWHRTDDSDEQPRSASPQEGEEADERARMQNEIRSNLRAIMVSVDLDEVTVMDLRKRLAARMDCDLSSYKKFIGDSVLFILGQLDSPTQIFDHVYLGSKWNACNLEELQANGVQYILNITREIDNFFIDVMKEYKNIRELDVETTELLPHWDETHRFINKARDAHSCVLVHCKMGVSRSASTVMAYAMKEYGWSLAKAKKYVTDKRSCVYPNAGFMRQLSVYEGMLNARQNRAIFAEPPTPQPRPQTVDVPPEEDTEAINVEQDIFQFKKAAPVRSLDDTNFASKSSTRSSAPSNRSLAADPMEESGGSAGESGRGGQPDTRMADLRFVRDELIEARSPTQAPWRRSLRRKTEETEINRVQTAPQAVNYPEPTSPSFNANRRWREDTSWIQNEDAWTDTPRFFLGGDVPGEESSTDTPRVLSWPMSELPVPDPDPEPQPDADSDPELRRSRSCCLDVPLQPGIVAKTRESIEARQRTGSESDRTSPSSTRPPLPESTREPRSASWGESALESRGEFRRESTRESRGEFRRESRGESARESRGEFRRESTREFRRESRGESTREFVREPARLFNVGAPVLRLTDGDALTAESSSDPLPRPHSRTLLLIRQLGHVMRRQSPTPQGQRVRRIVAAVEDSVDREPIRPVSQLVQRFRQGVGGKDPDAPRLRPKRTANGDRRPAMAGGRRASDCEFRRRRRRAEEEGGERTAVVMRHSNPIYNTM